MAYESYSKYLTVSKMHTDPSQHFKDSLQDIVDDMFDIASDYQTISLLNRDTLAKTSIGVRLEKLKDINVEASISDDFFKVIFKNFDTSVVLGDLFEFSNYRWLVTDIAKEDVENMSCIIQRCNVKLKFVYSNSEVYPTVLSDIISIDGVASKKSYDTENDRFYTIANELMKVKIPNNANGRKLRFDTKRGTRFLIGDPVQSYATRNVDAITMVKTNLTETNSDNGILLVNLQMDAFNSRTDNPSSMVAKQYCYGDVVTYNPFVPSGSDAFITSGGDDFMVEGV